LVEKASGLSYGQVVTRMRLHIDQAMIEVANVGRKAPADDNQSANYGISSDTLLPIFDIDVSGIKLTWFTDCTY
jgi:hypothetical protein